jgi:hypothetical protein
VVGAHLSVGAATARPIPVVLRDGEEASGLAEILQQLLEQTLAESPRKARRARRLSGEAVFRAAEDEHVCVRIRFAGDRIELSDGSAYGPRDALITADFLSIAHLTSGRETPFRLLAARRLRARFSPRDVPFLLGMLRLMRIGPVTGAARRRRWGRRLWPLAAAAGAGALYWYVTAAP